MIKLKSLFRRGQTPSGSSKYGPGQQPQQLPPGATAGVEANHSPDTSATHLKGSSSTSNIDGLGLSKAERKKQKEFGSRDNLDRKEHKSSKDRLVDNLRGKASKSGKESSKSKHGGKQETGQMSVLQHQQQPQASSGNSAAAYEHQRPSYGIVDASLVKELSEINFDGPREDAKAIQLHELRLQLDRVAAEKRIVEGQLAEMSLVQSEVMALRSEMGKMKVRNAIFPQVINNNCISE